MDPTPSDLTVIVPTYNEFDSLSANLAGWIRYSEARNWDLIIVDDGSSDETQAVLQDHLAYPRLRVLSHLVNRGYGAALKTGIHQVSTPFVATMDADGQHSIQHVTDLYEEMVSARVDMVIGARPAAATRDRYRRLGKAIIRRMTRLLFATDIRDLNSGLKVYKTEVVKRLLPFCPDSMAFSDIIALLHLNMKFQLHEVSVEIGLRTAGESTINTMTAIDTVLEIVNIVMWFRPLRMLLPFSAFLIFGGMVWAIPFLLAGRGLSSVALLLILGGFQIGVLALLAEQFAHIRRLDLPDVGFVELAKDDSESDSER